MNHDGVENNDGRRNKINRIVLPPSYQACGLSDRITGDRMKRQLNFEYTYADENFIPTIEEIIPKDLRERQPSFSDDDSIYRNMDIGAIFDEIFSVSQIVGKMLVINYFQNFENILGTLEQFTKLYKSMDSIHYCLKQQTKIKLLKMGFKVEKTLSAKGINYEVYWMHTIDLFLLPNPKRSK